MALPPRAAEVILDRAWGEPDKNVHADIHADGHALSFIEVRFVSPDASISDTPNFDDEFTQARCDAAKVADEQPINVTPQRLPPPRMVRDAEQETPRVAATSASTG